MTKRSKARLPGASHLVLRFAGDAERNMETVTLLRGELAA